MRGTLIFGLVDGTLRVTNTYDELYHPSNKPNWVAASYSTFSNDMKCVHHPGCYGTLVKRTGTTIRQDNRERYHYRLIVCSTCNHVHLKLYTTKETLYFELEASQ